MFYKHKTVVRLAYKLVIRPELREEMIETHLEERVLENVSNSRCRLVSGSSLDDKRDSTGRGGGL